MYVDKVLTSDDLHQLYLNGDIKRLYLGSVGFFNKGTYGYPALDLTSEQIAAVDEDTATDYWYSKLSYYVEHDYALGMYKDDYIVNIALGFIEDNAWHLCNTLIASDKDGTRAFMRDPEYHNVRGRTEKELGATIAYTYVDIGSPINDTLPAYKNHFGPIEECNVKNYNTLEHIGQETRTYSTGGQSWPGVKSTYSETYEKYKMEYY